MNHPPIPLAAFELSQQITIDGLHAEGCHGVSSHEKNAAQRFSIDAKWRIDARRAVLGDAIQNTVNYSVVAKEICRFVAENSYDLLETLAFNLSRHLLYSFLGMRAVNLKIRKFPASWNQHNTSFSVNFTQKWQRVFLGLGSNLGDRLAHLDEARRAVGEVPFCRLLRASAIHRTAPLLYLPQGEFLNQSLCVETLLLPEELLRALQAIEIRMGREKSVPKGPRIIDIDILLYGNSQIRLPDLQIPHAALQSRRFWIEELAELGVRIPPENAAVLGQGCVVFLPQNTN